jgi:endo-1,4-beta-xylanase
MQPAGHRIGDLWNGTLQQYGESVAVANAQWNAVVKADGSTDFGLIGTATGGSPAPPALTCQAL